MPMMWSAGIKAVVLIVCLAVADSFSFAAKQSLRSTSYLNLGFLDGIFGKSQSASAYHILLEGPTASIQCEKLKMDIYKKAIGRGSPEDGVDPEKLMKAVSLTISLLLLCGYILYICLMPTFSLPIVHEVRANAPVRSKAEIWALLVQVKWYLNLTRLCSMKPSE